MKDETTNTIRRLLTSNVNRKALAAEAAEDYMNVLLNADTAETLQNDAKKRYFDACAAHENAQNALADFESALRGTDDGEWIDNRSLHPLMTLPELCDYFKANFMTGDPDTVGDFIVAGKYPFASGLPADSKHNRRFQIFRAGAYAWLDEMTHSNTYKGEKL